MQIIGGIEPGQVFVVPDDHPLATGVPAVVPQEILDVQAAVEARIADPTPTICQVTITAVE